MEEIYLHLYPNAFKDENSTMAKEFKADNYMHRVDSQDRGYLDIQQLQIVRRTETIDWESVGLSAYEIDDTILKAKLPDPLPPGGELLIELTFYAENVHDFAWLASPDFLYEGGEWDGIPILAQRSTFR